MKNLFNKLRIAICIALLFGQFSCDDFVKIDPPRTELVRSTVFESDETAEAAVIDIYYYMRGNGFASGGNNSISFLAALSADEVTNFNTSSTIEYEQVNDNTLDENNFLLANLWSEMYNAIYKANAVIEGISSSESMSTAVKEQLIGEAKFIRAFCHFYLVNLWGDIPLITTTDYQTNNSIVRTPSSEIYSQIVLDLKEAQDVLKDDYSASAGERVRANRGAATALLARVYLYMEDWDNAEVEASKIIAQESLYQIEHNLSEVYRTTSKEVILQLWSRRFPMDLVTFYISPAGPLNGALRVEFVDRFEPGDQRWTVWGQSLEVAGVQYYGPLKYQDFSTPPLDFTTLFRLSEQYLIRSEARAHLGDLDGSIRDIDVIRNRAGLPDTSADDAESLLLAVEQERQSEFFTEWGHRWFDLKRTGRATAVLSAIKPEWNQEDVLYPIPAVQILNNPNITQNP